MSPRHALRVRGLTKAFGGTRALDDFAFAMEKGEVHALIGGNGSGKSTFIKVLAGVQRGDAGEAEFEGGEAVDLTEITPQVARDNGLRFVHQDLGIFAELSVAENLAVGHGFNPTRFGRIRWRSFNAAAAETLRRFHLPVRPDVPASWLSPPQLSLLAIARALQTVDADAGGILILDEPTASLPPEEAAELLRSVRRLSEQGHAILLVTHRLDEIRTGADRVTAIRDGHAVTTIAASTMTHHDAVDLILGHSAEISTKKARAVASTETRLELRSVAVGPVRDASLSVAAGEVVGVAGLLGSGRTELLETIFGVRPGGGDVALDGRLLKNRTPRQMRRDGVAFIPADRAAEGVLPDFTVAENITAGRLAGFFKRGILSEARVRRDVDRAIDRFKIKTEFRGSRIESLSGGNQQKVVLARWFREKPRLILLDEPTQGIDLAAREEIFALIEAMAEGGASVLIVSSEFEELARLSDRIMLLANGELTRMDGGTSPTGAGILEAVLTANGSRP